MTEIYRKITVDLARKSDVRLVFARQNDVGSRNLLITLTDSGERYIPEPSSSASLNFKRADGVCGAVAADIDENGVVNVTLPRIVLGVMGRTLCSVSIFDADGNKLTSSDFSLDVMEEFFSGEFIDVDANYSLLESVMGRLATFTEAERMRSEAEDAREEQERERQAAEADRERRIDEYLGVGGEIVLAAEAWSLELTRMIVLDDVGVNDMVFIQPKDRLDRDIAANCSIFVRSERGSNIIYFSALSRPDSDVSFNYFVARGRSV